MIDLTSTFDRVLVVNLDLFPERWDAFQQRAEKAGLGGFERFRAIEGDKVVPPVWWRAGNGAWGCLMSHLRIAQDAIMDGLDSVLILEDDALFRSDFAERFPAVMAEAGPPEDWDMLYLGGQHLTHHSNPSAIEGKERLLAGFNVNRTHAYAISGRFLVKFAQHIIHAPDYLAPNRSWHIDHQLGNLHEGNAGGDYTILACHPWLCGQAAGKSWTSGKQTQACWWQVQADKIGPPKTL